VIWEQVSTYGSPVLIGVFVLSVYRGWLVPARVLTDFIAMHHERLVDKTKEATEWKAAYQAESAKSAVLVRQMEELMESARLTQHIVSEIPKRGGSRDAAE
jgi:hypothetical protein